MGRTNSRRDYGVWLMENARHDSCAYCDVSLADSYHHWLLLNVDHGVPARECARLGIPDEWHHSFTNAVLSCFGCNFFDNRYSIERQAPKASDDWTVCEFIALRDRIFSERRKRIGVRRASDIGFFEKSIASLKLAHDLGISQNHVWHLVHRRREGWKTKSRKLRGPLEFDETYIGGMNKKRPYSRHLQNTPAHGANTSA